MKKSLLFSSMVILSMGILASCSSDPDYDSTDTINVSEAQFPYDKEGVWADNNESGYLTIDDYEFSHIVDNGYVYGFTPSKVADTSLQTPLYEHPYASASGGGVEGPGSQYLVGYWAEFLEGTDPDFDSRTCRIYAEDGDQFEPQSVMVCNTTYMMYELLNGSDFLPKAGPGTWVGLTVHGVHLDGTESEVTYDLVNVEETNVKDGILMAWAKFDLKSLGKCTGIYFTMDCSDDYKNSYGMLLPSYFCIDQLVVKD